MFFYHTPGQLPPHDTGHGVKTVALGWVGAPNERTPFRIHDAVVGLSIDVCRGLGISPLRTKHPPEFFSSRCWLKIGPRIDFRAFPKVWNFPFEETRP